jgi:hypothetical protein
VGEPPLICQPTSTIGYLEAPLAGREIGVNTTQRAPQAERPNTQTEGFCGGFENMIVTRASSLTVIHISAYNSRRFDSLFF